MKKNHLQFTFQSSFSLEQMLSTLQWCIYQLVVFLTKLIRRLSYMQKLDDLELL